MKKNNPRIMVWDIETGYNLATIFGLFNDRIPHDAIVQERYMISVSWKWHGEKRINAYSILDDPSRFAIDPHDDYAVCEKLHSLIEGADALVAHYGDKYDLPFLNSRLIYHGFKPLPPIITYDTYKMAKQKFKFNSNRLDYIGKYLGFGGKKHTRSGLWMDCFNGKKSAVKEMIAYNKQDVALLDDVFGVMKPWFPAKLNMNLFADENVCPHCKGTHIQKRGLTPTRTTFYQRYQCQECGHWFRGKEAVKRVEMR